MHRSDMSSLSLPNIPFMQCSNYSAFDSMRCRTRGALQRCRKAVYVASHLYRPHAEQMRLNEVGITSALRLALLLH